LTGALDSSIASATVEERTAMLLIGKDMGENTLD
jgi:hypothetical protein